jgi:hypothetical protein
LQNNALLDRKQAEKSAACRHPDRGATLRLTSDDHRYWGGIKNHFHGHASRQAPDRRTASRILASAASYSKVSAYRTLGTSFLPILGM